MVAFGEARTNCAITHSALVDQLGELVLLDVGIEAPGMREEHGLAGAPIVVEQTFPSSVSTKERRAARGVFGRSRSAALSPAAIVALTAAAASEVATLLQSIVSSVRCEPVRHR